MLKGNLPASSRLFFRTWTRDDLEIAMTLWGEDRKSTRLNSSHVSISYAVFCLKKKTAVDEVDVQFVQAPRRRARQAALVARAHVVEPALRQRHQGPGRLPHLLRTARLVRSRRK